MIKVFNRVMLFGVQFMRAKIDFVKKIILLFLIFYSHTVVSETTPLEFPEGFDGVWNTSMETCEDSFSDSVLKIDGEYIEFHESFGRMTGIKVDTADQFVAMFDMAGEGLEWEATFTLSLSADGSVLTDYFEDGTNIVRLRCPDNIQPDT